MLLRATDVPEAKTKILPAKKEQATTGIQALRGHHHPNIHIQPLFINTYVWKQVFPVAADVITEKSIYTASARISWKHRASRTQSRKSRANEQLITRRAVLQENVSWWTLRQSRLTLDSNLLSQPCKLHFLWHELRSSSHRRIAPPEAPGTCPSKLSRRQGIITLFGSF